LYSGGRVEAQIAMGEANLKAAAATFDGVRQQIIFTIRQAYYPLLLAQAGLASANHSVTQAAENLRVARARVASGVSPKFDEVQADVTLATARQAQVRARNGLAQGMQALNGLLNLPLQTPLTPTNPFIVSVVETPLDRLVSQALETRPELAEVRARQAAAQAGGIERRRCAAGPGGRGAADRERALRRRGGHQPRGAQRAGRVVAGRSRKGTSVLYLQRGPGRAGAGRGRRGELTVKSRRRLIIPVAILVIGAGADRVGSRGVGGGPGQPACCRSQRAGRRDEPGQGGVRPAAAGGAVPRRGGICAATGYGAVRREGR